MKNIAVIGAGTMGNGIVHTFAQYGYTVYCIDSSQKALHHGIATITKNLERMVVKQKITAQEKEDTLERITATTDLKTGVQHAELVIEAATEKLEIKKSIFSQLDTYCNPETILATNTSSISITEIASTTQHPERVIGMHFMNPVPLMPLVEIICGYTTSKTVLQKVIAIAERLEKTPIAVQDYPGFIANRILMPMINEAIESLFQGIAGVQEIDGIMKLGMAHPMGPLQLADYIGLDVCLSIMNVLYEGFKNPKYAPCPLLVTMVSAGKLGVKSGEGFYEYKHSKKAEKVAKRFR